MEEQAYAASLQKTLEELQRHVDEHQDKLNELHSKEWPLPTPIRQIQIITTAYDELTNSEPFLPHPDSLLPALLALRKTHQTIVESQAFLASQNEATDKEKRQLEAEKAALGEHKLLNEALVARIASLRDEVASEAEMRPEDVSRRRMEELQKKKKYYNKETSGLMKALNSFINEHLAAMLAAEELGGPVVGDSMDIDADDLAAGFSSRGKLKRKAKDDAAAQDDHRQRRIDEIWGPAAQHEEQQQQQQQGRTRQARELDAAATEMRQLTEELLNKLVEARGITSESYVELPRESAAARFLIRSKVAEFHPKDATRMRLVDFGRELER